MQENKEEDELVRRFQDEKNREEEEGVQQKQRDEANMVADLRFF